MPNVCVTFDHPDGIYYSGDTLNGIVVLTTNTSETIRGISIQINGYAKVKWSEYHGRVGNDGLNVQEFSAYDQYINSTTYVIGSDSGQAFNLAPGKYNHTFSCLLPINLPTSCQGEHGEIRYEVIVTTNLPHTFDNVFKQVFTVIQQLNLNLDSSLQVPQNVENWELPCCCYCCGCDKISAVLTIPYSGYVPGQKIIYQFSIFNDTNIDLKRAMIKLEKYVIFEARSPVRRKRITNVIYSKLFEPILRLTRKEYIDTIELPSIPTSTTNPEQCIRFEYLLIADVIIGNCANEINLVIPIKIGTIPIDNSTIEGNIIRQQPTAPIIDKNFDSISTIPVSDQQNNIHISSSSYLPIANLTEKEALSSYGTVTITHTFVST